MLSQIATSERIPRQGVPAEGALTPRWRLAAPRLARAEAALEIGLHRSEPRSFMRHNKPDSNVAQPRFRRATEKRRAGWGGTVP